MAGAAIYLALPGLIAAERDAIRTVLGKHWWHAVVLTAGRLGFDG